MIITINVDQLQRADDGDTTHYGGVVLVDTIEVKGTGTDRDTNLPAAIIDAIENELGRPLTDAERDVLDQSEEFNSLYENVELDFAESGLTVTVEPASKRSWKGIYCAAGNEEAVDALLLQLMADHPDLGLDMDPGWDAEPDAG